MNTRAPRLQCAWFDALVHFVVAALALLSLHDSARAQQPPAAAVPHPDPCPKRPAPPGRREPLPLGLPKPAPAAPAGPRVHPEIASLDLSGGWNSPQVKKTIKIYGPTSCARTRRPSPTELAR